MHHDLSGFSPCDALVAAMFAVSAMDPAPRTANLLAIDRIVDHAPVFADYDGDRIRAVAQTVMALFEDEDGLDTLFALLRDTLPVALHDTAYALACDVAAAAGHLGQVEVVFLAELRAELGVERLHAAAIELSARVRHRVLPVTQTAPPNA